MNHASLFSGIGGFDLAAEWMGWNNILSCEIDPFCNKVLKYHFPNSIHYEDIKTTDFTIHRGQIDILTGGFPCQPFSLAGKRRGSEDDRHLWPEMLRAIREIQPGWIVGENVFGLTNWNGGVVFREVLSELENEGYEVQPFIIPACAVNAPHRRDRVWIVAHAVNSGSRIGMRSNGGGEAEVQGIKRFEGVKFGAGCQNGAASDTEGSVCEGECECGQGKGEFGGCDCKGIITYTASKRHTCEEHGVTEPGFVTKDDPGCGWSNFPTQSPLRVRDDGFSAQLDGITVSKLRNESIKAGGNAIVPQVALQIFKAIEQYVIVNKNIEN